VTLRMKGDAPPEVLHSFAPFYPIFFFRKAVAILKSFSLLPVSFRDSREMFEGNRALSVDFPFSPIP